MHTSLQPHLTTRVASVISCLFVCQFFLGLEVDIDHMKKSLRQSVPIAVCSIVVPFACGAVLSLWFYDIETTSSSFTTFLLFLGTSLSFTAFPVLARVLTSAKLVTSPVGGQALGCAAVDDLLAWCTLAVTLSYASGGGIVAGIYVALITLGLVLFLVFVIRPFLVWYHQRLIAQDDELNRNFLALLFLLLCLTAWFSEILGIEAFCGSFIFGIMVPKEGQLIDNLAPKIELLIVEFFLPLYFANSGLRTNIGGLNQGSDWGAVFAVIAIGSAAKMIPVTLLARLTVRLNKYGQLFSMAQAAEANAGGDDLVPALHAVEPADEGTPMPWRQCLTLGVLMNTRGLIALIVLNIGLSADILGTKVFTIMVVFSLVTTFVTPPSVHYLYAAPYHAAREAKLKEVELIELDSMAKQRQVDEMLEEEANDVVNVFPPSDATVNDGSASPTGDEQHAHPALQGAEVRLSVDAGGEGTVAAVGVDAPVTRLHIYPAQRSPSVSVSHLDRREADILATQLAAFGNTDHTGVELARREPVHRADSHHNTGSRKLGSRQASHDSHAAPRFIEEAESPVTHLTSAIGDFFFGPAHPTVVEEEEDEQRSLSVRHALADAARREEGQLREERDSGGGAPCGCAETRVSLPAPLLLFVPLFSRDRCSHPNWQLPYSSRRGIPSPPFDSVGALGCPLQQRHQPHWPIRIRSRRTTLPAVRHHQCNTDRQRPASLAHRIAADCDEAAACGGGGSLVWRLRQRAAGGTITDDRPHHFHPRRADGFQRRIRRCIRRRHTHPTAIACQLTLDR